jgi:hypothetical protein
MQARTHLQKINDGKRDIDAVTVVYGTGLTNHSKHQPEKINVKECLSQD